MASPLCSTTPLIGRHVDLLGDRDMLILEQSSPTDLALRENLSPILAQLLLSQCGDCREEVFQTAKRRIALLRTSHR